MCTNIHFMGPRTRIQMQEIQIYCRQVILHNQANINVMGNVMGPYVLELLQFM